MKRLACFLIVPMLAFVVSCTTDSDDDDDSWDAAKVCPETGTNAFRDCTIIRLEWNYRSVPGVLHFANGIFTNKPLRLRKVLRAGNSRGSGGNPLFRENRDVEIWENDNPVEEMMRIIARMKELREGYDLQWKNFAILVRYNRLRLYYEEALRDALIPVAGQNDDDEGETVEDGVHVETVHASKGLQYAVVFYAGLAEGLTPGECLGNRTQRKMQLDEERRLFYVGVTRAEAYLILLYCRRRFWKGRLRIMRRSRFLPKQTKVEGYTKMPLLLFKVFVVVGALGYMFVHIPLFLSVMLFKKNDADRWLEYKIQCFSKFCMKILRVNLTVLDQANLAKVDWTRPVFVMGNHGSYVDIRSKRPNWILPRLPPMSLVSGTAFKMARREFCSLRGMPPPVPLQWNLFIPMQGSAIRLLRRRRNTQVRLAGTMRQTRLLPCWNGLLTGRMQNENVSQVKVYVGVLPQVVGDTYSCLFCLQQYCQGPGLEYRRLVHAVLLE